MIKIDNYYLDLNKVTKLKSDKERDRIHSYYLDMMNSVHDKRDSMANSIFYTLYKAGYLKELIDEKIDQVLS